MTQEKKPKPLEALRLSADQLYKSFQGREVVRGVSLFVRTGEIVALLGPNGAGKTTCFSMLSGFLSPDKGVISIGGIDVTALPLYMRARLGLRYLPQQASVFSDLSAEKNLLIILEFFYSTKAQQKEQLENLLSEFSLVRVRDVLAKNLSGGERRRLEIARCLIGQPKFILLDEPLAGIDPKMVKEVRLLLKALKKRGLGIFVTDHNVREMLKIVDRAYILNQGVCLKEGTAQEIAHDPVVKEAYLGEDFKL